MAAMDMNIHSSNDNEKMLMSTWIAQICAGCAASTNDEDEDTLVLFCCDKEVVVDDSDDSNSSYTAVAYFCKDCVVQEHGGGAKREHVQALDDLRTLLSRLRAPASLQQLQLALEQGESIHTE
jgi:hypothetical protein